MVTSYLIAGMELLHGIFSLWEEIPKIFLIFIVVFPNCFTMLSLFWVDNLPTNLKIMRTTENTNTTFGPIF